MAADSYRQKGDRESLAVITARSAVFMGNEKMMKETMKNTAAGISARRMVKQYIQKFYSTCLERC